MTIVVTSLNEAHQAATADTAAIREEAANFLGLYDYGADIDSVAKAITALVQLANDEDVDVRLAATSSLGIMGNNNQGLAPLAKPALATLINALDDPERSVRFTATSSLGMIGAYHKSLSDIITPPLVLRLKRETDTGFRIVLVKALGRVASAKTVDDVAELLAAPSACLQVIASRTLTRIGTDNALAMVANWKEQHTQYE